MLRIILDTNAIIKNPSIVTFDNGDSAIHIPAVVMEELSAYDSQAASGSAYIQLIGEISEYADEGYIIIEPYRAKHLKRFYSDQRSPYITDHNFVFTVEDIIGDYPEDEIIVVSDDRVIQNEVALIGGRVISVDNFTKQYLAKAKPPKSLLIKATNKVGQLQRKYIVINSFVTFIFGALGYLVASNFSLILSTIKFWGTVIAIPLIGILLYWFRSKYRLGYAGFEILFGFVASVRVFLPDFEYENLTIVNIIQLIG